MNNPIEVPKNLTRITCLTHHQLGRKVTECLTELGIGEVCVEPARCVRYRIRSRIPGLPGQVAKLDDAPADVFRAAVPPAAAGQIARALTAAAELNVPGHGMLYLQDIVEYGGRDPAGGEQLPDTGGGHGRLRDLALLTAILSMTGSGENLARVALKLGAGVPFISRGVGTGIRDRLGLLRIVIPPEKEIVRLIVPAHDAGGIRRLLIEEGRMDRSGGGFLYQTDIREGVVDPLMRIGRQEHAASMEQIVAALDDLKTGTAWRKRYYGFDGAPEKTARRIMRDYREITFICPEGQAENLVRAAMEAGAGGATISYASRLRPENGDDGGGALETGVICAPAALRESVCLALCGAAARGGGEGFRIQVLNAPVVFTHQRAGE